MSLILSQGSVYGFGDIRIVLFGSPLAGLEKIEYKTSQRKENVYGTGRNPIGQGRGNFEYTASIDILYDEWVKICRLAPFGDPLQIPRFTITVLYGDGITIPKTDILENCQFMENPLSSVQNDTSIKVSIPLLIAGISYNV